MKGSRRPGGDDREAKKKHADEQKLLQAQALTADLKAPGGKHLMKLVTKRLVDRAKKLVKDDPECKALLAVVEDVNGRINLADGIVKELLGKAGALSRED